MVSHIIFRPNEGEDIFGSLGELIDSIHRVYQAVDVVGAVLVLYTILFPLEYISNCSNSFLVTTFAPTPASAMTMASSAVYSYGSSNNGQCAWG